MCSASSSSCNHFRGSQASRFNHPVGNQPAVRWVLLWTVGVYSRSHTILDVLTSRAPWGHLVGLLAVTLNPWQAYWRVTSKRVVDNACMLLETSFLGEAVDRIETQLLALTQEITQEEIPVKAAAKESAGWQQPRLGIFNVRETGNSLPLAVRCSV